MPRQLFLLEYYCEKCCGNVPSCLNPQHATSIIPTAIAKLANGLTKHVVS